MSKSVNYCVSALTLISLLCPICLNAQISISGQPVSSKIQLSDSVVPIIKLPSVNTDSLRKADSIKGNSEAPLKYGIPIDVDFGIRNFGRWDTLSNGNYVWRLKIISTGAKSINLVFDTFNLAKKSVLYIYNNNKEHVIGGFTHINNKPYSRFATDLLGGDTATLELYTSHASHLKSDINIDIVGHGYKRIISENGTGGLGESGDCEVNVNCSSQSKWCVEQKSVAMIIDGSDCRICSGTMINNANSDLTPYFLTAFHCLDDNSDQSLNSNEKDDIQDWVFRFNYWDPDCDNEEEESDWYSIFGATSVKSSNAPTDAALLKLSSSPKSGSGIHFAGFSLQTDATNPPNNVTGIHHPAGDVMKISHDDEQPSIVNNPNTGANNTHWFIEKWDEGTTTGGSSGSALFNDNRRIIGQDHAGDGESECDPEKGTKYGRFDISWSNGFSNELDPNGKINNQIGPTGPPIFLLNKTYSPLPLGNPRRRLASISELELEGNVSFAGPMY